MSRTLIAAIALASIAGPSLAEPAPTSAPASAPAALLLPVKTIMALRQYLGTRPYDETAGLVAALEACAQVQIPVNGAIRSSGQCPDVTAALRAKDATKPAPTPTDEKK